MIRESELQELVEFQGKKWPVVSLYLNIDPRRRTVEKYKLSLRRLMSSISSDADAADIQRINRYFDFEHNWQGRGVACFSGQAQDFFRAYPLSVPVEDAVFVNPRFYVKPLSKLMDDYARHGVAVIDQEGVRLFVFFMGGLEEASGLFGEDVKRHKAGGRSAARYQRATEETAERNIKEAVDESVHFFTERDCRRVILAGTDANVAQFRGQLPKIWQDRVVGTFSVDANANAAQIGELALGVAQQVASQREALLLEQIVTTATKGGPAVIGLADTISALQDGRVHQLVMVENFQAAAYRCQNCGYISLAEQATCHFCGGPVELVSDVINTIVRRTLEAGNEVVVVQPNEHISGTLYTMGDIGALLRY